MAGADPQLRSARRAQHRGGLGRRTRKKQNTGEVRSPVSKLLAGFTPAIFSLAWSPAAMNSECPEQDSADENEHGAYSKHFGSQGKVHGSASLVDVAED